MARRGVSGVVISCMFCVLLNRTLFSDFWRTHDDLKLIEEIQAFGKMMDADEAVAVASSSEDSGSEDGEDDSDEKEEIKRGPKVQNAFDLLNDED